MRIIFSNTEKMMLDMLAHMRYIQTQKHGKEKKQSKNIDAREMNRNGVYTEYAVSRYLNVHFDLNCDYRDFGPDLISNNGSLIEVKSTKKKGGSLNAHIDTPDKPGDIFIATEIDDEDVVTVIGFIEREFFLKPENLIDVGNGFFYSVPQTVLKKFRGFQYPKSL